MSRGGSRVGAGRPAYRVKAEGVQRIGVHQLASCTGLRAGSYVWSWHRGTERTGSITVRILGAESLRLEYTVAAAGEKRNGDQQVALCHTPCHYGGSRPWFGCPVCSQRVGVLYLRQGRFACRKCQRVAYASQSEDACGRSWRAQQKLERRLGDDWQRPKGMRAATHDKLVDRLSACEEIRENALTGVGNALKRWSA